MRRCCGRFWRKCKPSRFAVSENQPYGRRPVGSPRDGLCPGIGSWGRNVAHECRWEVKCPCASPDFDFRHRIRVGQTALEFIWIRKPLNCVKPTDYRVGVEKCGLVLASILVARDSLVGRYPMGRIISGIKATSGSAPLGSAVYYFCRHVLYQPVAKSGFLGFMFFSNAGVEMA